MKVQLPSYYVEAEVDQIRWMLPEQLVLQIRYDFDDLYKSGNDLNH